MTAMSFTFRKHLLRKHLVRVAVDPGNTGERTLDGTPVHHTAPCINTKKLIDN